MHEIIIHPRTRVEFYKGRPHAEVMKDALSAFSFPVIYNGDIFTAEDSERIQAEYPKVSGQMLGRGLIANPALARQLKGGKPAEKGEIKAFHDLLFERYLVVWPKNAVAGHMCEIMSFMCCMFERPEKMIKTLRKSQSLEAYKANADKMLDEFPLTDEPGYSLW